MYISKYSPPDIGNSFCLVVRIFGSEPKGPRFYPAAKVVTRNNFQSHYRWRHQKSGQFHLLLHSPDGSTTTPTATQLSQFKACDAFHNMQSLWPFHSTKSARACAPPIWAAICAYARSTSLP
ncbi:hypothetical protein AVEN_273170-1 [Araneus ventricosus]|uniref:Uncharacterized protein n=1 Tax=Araneus ventricosus TaxID=182803 RepID=A0A4Y2W224_ARAVE|nr:hypothetical protein AVEN_273170-1 [Araneus ventricosus]